jgi:hypothetical protein
MEQAMTTVSDATAAADRGGMPTGSPVAESDSARGTRSRAHARIHDTAVTERRRGLRSLADVLWADFTGAWGWRALAGLWQHRVPAVEDVPGESRALRAAWVAYNHVALVVVCLLAVVVWVLLHPARFLLAAVIAAPLIAMWIS